MNDVRKNQTVVSLTNGSNLRSWKQPRDEPLKQSNKLKIVLLENVFKGLVFDLVEE